MKAIAYTDGSCNYKTGDGGYGIYMVLTDDSFKDIIKTEFRGFSKTKTGRMEIGACLASMIMAQNANVKHLHIKSDSQYVVNTITNKWYERWKEFNWYQIKNKDLWLAVIDMLEYLQNAGIKIEISWVKGHSGIHGNEMADSLARQGYKSEIKSLDNNDLNNW